MYHLSPKIPTSHRKPDDNNDDNANDKPEIKTKKTIKDLAKIDTTIITPATTTSTSSLSTPTKVVDLPARRISTSEASTQTNKPSVSPEEIECLLALKTLLLKSKRLMEIFTYCRLALVITLYVLITFDIVLILNSIAKELWVEILTQVVNGVFTLLTLIVHPKRIRNLPRAIKILIGSRKRNQRLDEELPLDVKITQKLVNESYEWYIYEGDKSLICSPIKLCLVLTLWNIGSLSQYGICAILLLFPPIARPITVYIALGVVSIICEIVPIPIVVIQFQRANTARFMDTQSRLLPTRKNSRFNP
ncbi:12769_t:CDS:2 [Entrophospora sp. SA101]|nr:12769_t:CDS:2 [Entrophospora sp. SA101]CAJ0837366.1 15583_t:CDS:2 [Entrophospora sp. SA101]